MELQHTPSHLARSITAKNFDRDVGSRPALGFLKSVQPLQEHAKSNNDMLGIASQQRQWLQERRMDPLGGPPYQISDRDSSKRRPKHRLKRTHAAREGQSNSTEGRDADIPVPFESFGNQNALLMKVNEERTATAAESLQAFTNQPSKLA